MELNEEKLMKEIVSISNISELSAIQNKINELRKSLDDSLKNLSKKAIIDFISTINLLPPKWKDQEISDIANDLINFYSKENINELLAKRFTIITNPLLKFLIDIDKVFPKEKEHLILYFKIILLSQNKEILINYIKSISVLNIQEIEKEISNLNFHNPFSIIFLHELFRVIFDEKNKNINAMDTINNNIKDIQIFRCRQCFDLL